MPDFRSKFLLNLKNLRQNLFEICIPYKKMLQLQKLNEKKIKTK